MKNETQTVRDNSRHFPKLLVSHESVCQISNGPMELFHIWQWNLLNVRNVVAKGFQMEANFF